MVFFTSKGAKEITALASVQLKVVGSATKMFSLIIKELVKGLWWGGEARAHKPFGRLLITVVDPEGGKKCKPPFL